MGLFGALLGGPTTDKSKGEKLLDSLFKELQVQTDYAPPSHAASTTIDIEQTWAAWSRFCQQYHSKGQLATSDPKTVCSTLLNHVLIRAFLVWICENSHIKKCSTLLQHAKKFRMAFHVHMRREIQKEIKQDMKNYIFDTLVDEFGLSLEGEDRDVMSADDILGIEVKFWCHTDDWYGNERQRLQDDTVRIFCGSTTARAGTIVESTCWRGSNEAVTYGDIKLFAMRDPDHKGKTILGMLIKLRYMKGRRAKGTPPIVKIIERRDTPSFCLVLRLLGIMFDDMPFASEYIRKPADLWNIRIPVRRESVPVEWQAKWENVPILRRNQQNSWYTSPNDALQYSQVQYWTQRVGITCGMQTTFKLKMLRRGTGRAVDKIASTGIRKQVMGHVNDAQFDQSYRGSIVDADIVAAFLEKPSNDSVMRLMGQIRLTWDPNAPKALAPTQRTRLHEEDPEIIAARSRLQDLRTQITKTYITIQRLNKASKTNKDGVAASLCVSYSQAQRAFRNLTKSKERELLDSIRKEYFKTIGATCLTEQHSGKADVDDMPAASFRFPEREVIARLLFKDLTKMTYDEMHQTRCDIVSAFAGLCQRYEPPRPSGRKRSRQQESDQTSKKQVREQTPEPCFLDHEPDSYPLLVHSTVCLFCLGDEALPVNDRVRQYTNVFALTRHVSQQHFPKFAGKPFLCGHPLCKAQKVSCSSVNHFKCHALTVHNVVHNATRFTG